MTLKNTPARNGGAAPGAESPSADGGCLGFGRLADAIAAEAVPERLRRLALALADLLAQRREQASGNA